MYAYPFIHHQSFAPAGFTTGPAPVQPTRAILLGLIAADLVALTVGVVQTSRLIRGSGPNFASPNPFAYEDLRDITLDFNGLIMYNAPGAIYKLYNIQSMVGSGEFQNSFINQSAGGVAPFTSTPIDTNMVVMNFARLRQLAFEGQYQNVWQIGNNTLTLQFGGGTLLPNTQYTLFVTYHYNAIVESQNGQSTIYFN